jgi:flagellar hook-associated protein 1 FlgK
MSGLFTTLHGSVKALAAHGRAIETAGRNLANVNNPAYARQRVQYGDRGTVITADGAQSLGLEALAVQQLRDELLDRQVAREGALQAMFTAEQRALARAEAGLGQNVDRSQAATAAGSNASTGGLAGALDDFFNAFQGLAARPTDAGERQSLLQKAAILVDRFSLTDRRLAQAQADIDTQVGEDVAEANRLLATVADLNAQIGRIEIGKPGAAIDLRDQRQARLEELSRLLPVEVRDTTDGQVDLLLRDGTGAEVPLVQLATVTGPLAFDGTGVTGGAPATALDLASGSIRGALRARDGAIQGLRSDLDLLARQMVVAVNGAYNPAAAPGADFFDPAGLAAGTVRLAAGLTPAALRAGTGAAGDNSVALAVAAVAGRRFSVAGGDIIEGSLGEHYARAVSDLGQALASAEARADDQENIERLVRTQRDSVSGVSLDEELADLVRYQRAFQASSRVFSMVDELLDTVVNRLGR